MCIGCELEEIGFNHGLVNQLLMLEAVRSIVSSAPEHIRSTDAFQTSIDGIVADINGGNVDDGLVAFRLHESGEVEMHRVPTISNIIDQWLEDVLGDEGDADDDDEGYDNFGDQVLDNFDERITSVEEAVAANTDALKATKSIISDISAELRLISQRLDGRRLRVDRKRR